MNQQKTPLFDALDHHSQMRPQSMHVPGHKYGQVFSSKGYPYFRKVLEIDATEITGLDDLHHPEGAILEAEKLVADLYGVEKSYFLVNGSTVGNLAMILAACSENDTVLVQRNSHKSILNGLKMAGARPVFIHPTYDDEVQVASYVSFNTVKVAFDTHPQIKAVILTNPNYFGMANQKELAQIITYAHKKGAAVLIDEAHGAHFLLEGFPSSAVSLGADIVVHSAHKTLPAMTMGSFLHINSQLIKHEEVEYYLQMLQSSSPSYPIMASLDLARHYLAAVKEKGTNQIIEKIVAFTQKLEAIPHIKVVTSENQDVQTDVLKLTIQSQCELNGYELQRCFEKEGLFTEMADPNNVLFVLPLSQSFDADEIFIKIRSAIKEFTPMKRRFITLHDEGKTVSTLALCYNEIKGYNKKVVSFKDAIGNISGEMIIPYPPGIPVLMEGECVTERHIEILTMYIETGAHFQGGDMRGKYIKILNK
ncbi:aminotransferase class I/II-fold pyridoxal phosphate-dependent enzyme [Fredinandcohnia sp. QZ13]|uniref:aminotransferase class I/II-fold pyridoxal phosphate-dependent enzyme n=1 Tax=Fredinandcohnia sp. QZ13 TaxID=3073144 RepID=UPI002853165E|nr:aminotransferase class I/II-fold pyridoxal phosphate-dependent enzyme [Fredinandcohnia sp. QZ13]MDR4888484.1 aminotransferase class I/II-fold pyridoxal phosphate-dependent enzyme [Fredinandcohnia sp. QZ13]